MSATFSRTLRSLQAERSRRLFVEALIVALFLSWTVWLLFARVAVFEVSEQARLEVKSAAHPVAAPVGGQIVETRLTIGRRVEVGEVLVVLDAEGQRRAVTERRVRRDGLTARRRALELEIAAEEEAARSQQKARATALEEAKAQMQQAQARAGFSASQLAVSIRLRARNAVSEEELRRDRAQVEVDRAAVLALKIGATRQEQDRTTQESERKARVAKLRREAAELEGDGATEEAAIRRLEHDLTQRVIRAPVAGRVGEAGEFHVGAVVRPADRLGAIVPTGEPRGVALFPAAAVGRIRPGQMARLRLDGFPWVQYGTLPATVTDVGNEPASGLIRVEFKLAPDPDSAIVVEHGLPGSAEVEVEHVSPAVLVLRAAGLFVAGRRTSDRSEAGTP
jgi:membrane fusion protein (multidrug efflux system)